MARTAEESEHFASTDLSNPVYTAIQWCLCRSTYCQHHHRGCRATLVYQLAPVGTSAASQCANTALAHLQLLLVL